MMVHCSDWSCVDFTQDLCLNYLFVYCLMRVMGLKHCECYAKAILIHVQVLIVFRIFSLLYFNLLKWLKKSFEDGPFLFKLTFLTRICCNKDQVINRVGCFKVSYSDIQTVMEHKEEENPVFTG